MRPFHIRLAIFPRRFSSFTPTYRVVIQFIYAKEPKYRITTPSNRADRADTGEKVTRESNKDETQRQQPQGPRQKKEKKEIRGNAERWDNQRNSFA
ncbi:hypothetical protein Trydic_g5233 [Trypoxylus dichotomus]